MWHCGIWELDGGERAPQVCLRRDLAWGVGADQGILLCALVLLIAQISRILYSAGSSGSAVRQHLAKLHNSPLRAVLPRFTVGETEAKRS
jgi:hypothetical protein